MTLLLVLLPMKEHLCFPETFNEGIKYFCDNYDSQGFEKDAEKLLYSENLNQLIKADSDIDER